MRSPRKLVPMARPQLANLLKSILHNMGVVLVGFALAFLGRRIDSFLGIPSFASGYAIAAGCLLLILGFLLRTWAAFYFYEHQMKLLLRTSDEATFTNIR
jgi:hypothetical protein